MNNRRFSIFIGLTLLFFLSGFLVVIEINPLEPLESRMKSSAVVSDSYTPHDAIMITSDEEFSSMAADEGWPGDGSADSPYVISGLLLTDPETQPIRIWNTEVHWIFSNNIVEGGGLCGCYIVNTVNGIVTNNTFRNRHSGIVLQDAENITVSENFIYNNTGNGLEVIGASTGLLVQDNDIHNNLVSGIYLLSAVDCEIDGNTIVDNEEYGISIPMGVNVVISDNNVRRHPSNGIITGSTNCTITGNTVTDSEMYGIVLSSGSRSDIIGNTIQDSVEYGVYLSSSTSNTTIMENVLIGNGLDCQIYDAGSDNEFIFNYYDDWTGPDIDSDDIVDNPYVADGVAENSDLYPLASPDAEIPDIITTTTETSLPPPEQIPLELVVIAGVATLGVVFSLAIIFKRRS